MRNFKSIILSLAFLALLLPSFAGTFKAGDKAEALINNTWLEVKILRAVAGKTGLYEVQSVSTTGKTTSVFATYEVKEENLRGFKQTNAVANTAITLAAVNETAALRLGKYNIYSGIPVMYIGNFELKEGGNYIVALVSDDANYATGTYVYHADTNTIEWKTGFFWQKKWEGKIISQPGGFSRIQFNRATYGDSNDR